MHRRIALLWIPILLMTAPACSARKTASPKRKGKVIPLPQAHAHNDYRHKRPLLDALDHGFCGVEADIYLVDGKLLVAHDIEDVKEERTLQALYLDPLKERISEDKGGRVYNKGPSLTLLIDIKSDGLPTYAALRETLKGYSDMLTTWDRDGMKEGSVTVIISGNRPREAMKRQEIRYCAYDGRLDDLGSDEPAAFIPLISDRWTSHFQWNGMGAMPEAEKSKLHEIVNHAHAKGQRVRFWATPDLPFTGRAAVWRELLNAGVDLLNTDDLAGLQKFLLEEQAGKD